MRQTAATPLVHRTILMLTPVSVREPVHTGWRNITGNFTVRGALLRWRADRAEFEASIS